MNIQPSNVQLWRCPNCGQVHFAEAPPDMCDFCRDFTTWQPISTSPSISETDASTGKGRKSRARRAMVSPNQLRLFSDDI